MNIAVIFAGGSGSRMHTKSRPKQFLNLHGKPILLYTIELFEEHPLVDAVVCVCIAEWIPRLRTMLAKHDIRKVVDVVPGGATGQESIFRGLCAAESYVRGLGASDARHVVMIHDGVRPLIDEATITANICKVEECGSCITCVPAIETVLVGEDDGSIHIPPRAKCMMARAPQSFWLDEILAAHRRSIAEGHTAFIDSCSMMHHYGYPLHTVTGPMENIKITTPTDYYVLRAMIEVRENQQIFGI